MFFSYRLDQRILHKNMVCLASETVLGLVLLFVCEPTHLLETGYMYPSSVIVDEGMLRHDLKCTYFFSGLTHLLVTKRLNGRPYHWPLPLLVGQIVKYSHTAKCQILSLYQLNVKRMGALWLLHLYLAMGAKFYGDSPNKRQAGGIIMAIHNLVIKQLREDLILADCRTDSTFNKESQIISEQTPLVEDLISLMGSNTEKANALLTINNLCDKQYLEEFGNSITLGSLLLNHIGSKEYYIHDLMDVFNVQVNWSSAGERLARSSDDVRVLNWPVDWVGNLKLYFELNLNFLKVIIHRLSLKHLSHLETFSGDDILYVRYAEEWYNKVKQFGEMLCLTEDVDVKELLADLDKLVKNTETIQTVEGHLIENLKQLCQPLGCVATNKFELDNKEFQTPFKGRMMYYNSFKVIESSEPIEYHSLENTRVFLEYVSLMFKYCDLNLVRLFADYIKQVRVEPR